MNIQENVKNYYGKVLQDSGDLKTDACSTLESQPPYLTALLKNIHPDVKARYYGCGLIAPLALDGACVLDLGAGSGQDAYALAQLVGPNGKVVGVDMTAEQLAVARNHQNWHAERFGYANVEFLEGDIEQLDALDLAANSFDVIVSNCVFNLLQNKQAVFNACQKLLKPGGELYFADIYSDRRLSPDLQEDAVAQGECLGGALYWNDFLNMARRSGFLDPRLVSYRPVAVTNAELLQKLQPAQFYSATYRLFKIGDLELGAENYGHEVTYNGHMQHAEDMFVLDGRNRFKKGERTALSGNSFRMLQESRFSAMFDFFGDTSVHLGQFADHGQDSPFDGLEAEATLSTGCC